MSYYVIIDKLRNMDTKAKSLSMKEELRGICPDLPDWVINDVRSISYSCNYQYFSDVDLYIYGHPEAILRDSDYKKMGIIYVKKFYPTLEYATRKTHLVKWRDPNDINPYFEERGLIWYVD